MLRKCSKNYHTLFGRTPLLSAALLSILTAQTAYSGSCSLSGSEYLCSGPTSIGSDATQIFSPDFPMITTPNFGIDTSTNGGNAFTLMTLGTISNMNFIDNNQSTIIGKNYGIHAQNHFNGALSITATGTVSGITEDGIYAENSGTDLTIHAHNAEGSSKGINAKNYGNGALSITATGTVTGITWYGIAASNSINGTDLTIHAHNAEGNFSGIVAFNQGTGALSIITTGLLTTTPNAIGGGLVFMLKTTAPI